MASLDGGPPNRLGVRDVLNSKDNVIPIPDVWTPDQKILFSMALGDSTNVWSIRLAPSGTRMKGLPERLTSGTGVELSPAIAGARVVFATQTRSIDLWRLSADTNKGEVHGNPEPVTHDAATDFFPWLSADASRMVFQSDRRGQMAT